MHPFTSAAGGRAEVDLRCGSEWSKRLRSFCGTAITSESGSPFSDWTFRPKEALLCVDGPDGPACPGRRSGGAFGGGSAAIAAVLEPKEVPR